jgi:hypothetical protein
MLTCFHAALPLIGYAVHLLTAGECPQLYPQAKLSLAQPAALELLLAAAFPAAALLQSVGAAIPPAAQKQRKQQNSLPDVAIHVQMQPPEHTVTLPE